MEIFEEQSSEATDDAYTRSIRNAAAFALCPTALTG